jgi:hypothetical protein
MADATTSSTAAAKNFITSQSWKKKKSVYEKRRSVQRKGDLRIPLLCLTSPTSILDLISFLPLLCLTSPTSILDLISLHTKRDLSTPSPILPISFSLPPAPANHHTHTPHNQPAPNVTSNLPKQQQVDWLRFFFKKKPQIAFAWPAKTQARRCFSWEGEGRC